jgi:hypothetical protein
MIGTDLMVYHDVDGGGDSSICMEQVCKTIKRAEMIASIQDEFKPRTS